MTFLNNNLCQIWWKTLLQSLNSDQGSSRDRDGASENFQTQGSSPDFL